MRVVNVAGIQTDVVKRSRLTDPILQRFRDGAMYRLKLAGYTYPEIARIFQLSRMQVIRRIQGLPSDVKQQIRKEFRGARQAVLV